MKNQLGPPEIGAWYARSDKGELFQVVGRDEHAGTIEIQVFDGDLDEIDDEAWTTLDLERAAPPEDWTGPVDDVEADDLGYTETEMKPTEWAQPLQALHVEGEQWEDTEPEEERDPLGEGTPDEALAEDVPVARDRAR